MTPEIVRKGDFQDGFPVLTLLEVRASLGTRQKPGRSSELSRALLLRSFGACEICRAQPLAISNQQSVVALWRLDAR